jgi:hypothetical protein
MPNKPTENPPPTIEEMVTGGESTPHQVVSGGSGGTGGSTYTTVYGRRIEKIYPITEDELDNLVLFGKLTTLCFSIMSSLLAVAFNIYLSVSLTQELPENKIIYWTTIQNFAFIIGLIFLAVGLYLVYFNRKRIDRIKSKTEF